MPIPLSLATFQDHLETSGIIPNGVRVVVGYSGGADSTALLHLLHFAGVDVVAAHLHHGQRDEADKERDLCSAFCQELDIPFMAGKANVPLMSQELKIGIEEAGRKARYNFFDQCAFRAEAPLIATAHTQTDHVETVLLHLARGSGIGGLAGIPAVRRNIVRPLLPFDREGTRAYCVEHHLWFHDDPGNNDHRFNRVRIRERIVPELQVINPSVADAISRLAEIAGEEDRFLDGMAGAALEKAEKPLNGSLEFVTSSIEIAFDTTYLRHLPPVLLRRAVLLATQAVGESLDYQQATRFQNEFSEGRPGSLTAEGGTTVLEWKDDLVWVRNLTAPEPFRFPLTVPGETISDEFNWIIAAMPSDGSSQKQSRTGLEVLIDQKSIKGNLYLRGLHSGDKIRPLGFEGHRSISDLLSESKLTPAAKSRLPIICDLVGPVWIPGVCIEDRVGHSSDGSPALLLRFGPASATAERTGP